MKVAIIGAGFTGLAAAIELLEQGCEITIFESEKKAGGQAIGFKDPAWNWSLERYYHHIFTNDESIKNLAAKVGCPPFFVTPKTNSLTGGKIKQLDSPISLLKFSDLSPFSRIRMGIGLLILKLIPNGIFFEKYHADRLLPLLVGQGGYEKVWRPLLAAKFGPYLKEVNMAWLWARIYKRTQSLGYFKGGFQGLADKTINHIKKRGGGIKLGVKIEKIKQEKKGGWRIAEGKFDKVLVTVPAPLIDKIVGKKVISLSKINYLWCQTTVVELKQSLMDGYWLNILDDNFPFMVAVEQTNLTDKKRYGGKTIVYFGNYLPANDKRLKMSRDQLLRLYLPFIKKINPRFDEEWVEKSWRFETPFAQPIFPTNYSRLMPTIKTRLSGLYVANTSMVYPWDRGTNYAVSLGIKAAKLMRDD